jgi:hypothetical protein
MPETSMPRWLRVAPWPGFSSRTSFSGGSLIEGAASIIIVWRSSGARTLAGDCTMLETMDSAPGSPGPS